MRHQSFPNLRLASGISASAPIRPMETISPLPPPLWPLTSTITVRKLTSVLFLLFSSFVSLRSEIVNKKKPIDKYPSNNFFYSGSSLAVLPLDDCGRKSKTMPLLHAHTDTVTDMDFSPFHDGLLATGSQDCLVQKKNFL